MIKKLDLKILEDVEAEVITADNLEAALEQAEKKQKPLSIKLGMDPTSPDLHLGHYVLLRILREFLAAGHKIKIIIGDFTAKIGDPSGRNLTRPILSDKEIKTNVKTYIDQLAKVLDVKKINPHTKNKSGSFGVGVKVYYNSEWFGKMKFDEILKLVSQFSLNRILDREDFKNRIKNQLEIRLHEVFYPLMQAYDSVVLESDIEFGGIDQRLNILAGRQLQESMNMKPQVAILTPLLVGLDGQKKMSKSLGNYVGLSEKPADMYGKIMSLKDELMPNYFNLILGYPQEEINSIKLKIENGENPMYFKKQLAYEIVKIFYSEKEANLASGNFTKVFSKREVPEEMPEAVFNETYVPLFEIIRAAFPESELSNSEIKRLITQGSVRIENKPISDPFQKIKLSSNGVAIKIGKHKWFKAIGK